MDKTINCIPQEAMEEDINFNFKKINYAVSNRKKLGLKTFLIIFVFMNLMSFILPKKWVVDSDLYINKSNNSNMAEVNPYFIEELGIGSGMSAILSGGSGNLLNEIELIESPLVLDKVIKENNLRFKKILGIIPTIKTGEYLTAEKFLKKGPKIEIKKGTNVVSISYKSKDRDLAYNVVNSLIKHYIELRKELTNEKSKSDTKILEAEYEKVKKELEKKIKNVKGMPVATMTGTGHIAAMSDFSISAKEAILSMQKQYIEGTKSELDLKEESEKLTQLAAKLQWAKLVEEMSESSKVIIIKEPHQLKDWEYASPKVFSNIILGIVFGIIGALISVLIAELSTKKLSYLMLGDNIIYNLNNEWNKFKAIVYKKGNEKLAFILFENITNELTAKLLQEFNGIEVLKADITKEFVNKIHNINSVIFFGKINETNAEKYKLIKDIVLENKKEILTEVLI